MLKNLCECGCESVSVRVCQCGYIYSINSEILSDLPSNCVSV